MNSTLHVDETAHGRVLELDLHGKLTREDYAQFVPETERMIEQFGKLRMLVIMHDFHGWDAGALWEDIKWEAKHFNQIDHLAIVGEKTWHKMMAGFCKPFTTATIHYFTMDQLEAARLWLREDLG